MSTENYTVEEIETQDLDLLPLDFHDPEPLSFREIMDQLKDSE